ncbi:substrate-binding domain-containing protein [Verrucomicrobiaceae bacterium R5-34]|nr:substrate-binding domain-containing protein [Verrucomicrobiaceae bacterium R5-34]
MQIEKLLNLVDAMKRIQIQSPLEYVVEELRNACQGGDWKDKLPGARILAKRLGVSAPTVLKALNQLVKEGVLEHPGPRKAFHITTAGSPNKPRPPRKKPKTIIILTHQNINELVASTRSILELLTTKLIAKGWHVRKVVVNFIHAKRPHRSWDNVIAAEKGTPIVAVYGRPLIAKWALERGLKILFFGGERGTHEVPVIGVKSHRLAKQAMNLLTEAGHSKIVLPLNDRPDLFKKRLSEITREAIESMGAQYHALYHNPESPYFAKDVISGLMQRLIPDQLPTAMVFLDWKELITAHCYLAQHGVRVPEEVSLILLNNQVEAEWFEPGLCRFEFPQATMAQAVIQWLETGQAMDQTIDIPATYLRGKTIAPPRLSAIGS